jgi:hypothetical protein
MKAKHIVALRWAVRQAEAWRGSLTDTPDPVTGQHDTARIEHFENMIADAKEALKEVGRPRGVSHDNEQRGNR